MSDAVVRLIGVYDADGTLLGELSYVVRARLGRAHCALCDITHGRIRERPEWTATRDRVPVPFETYHRDDQPPAVRSATGSTAPVVVAETSGGRIVTLLGRRELEDCAGSPARLVERIQLALGDHDLSWAGE